MPPIDLDAFSDPDFSEKELPVHNPSYVRCACGNLFCTHIPCVCRCGEIKAYWRSGGKVHPLGDLSVGHLAEIVKLLAEHLGREIEKGRQEGVKLYEVAIDIVYREIGSRDQELTQLAGIAAALTRSIGQKRDH